MFQTSAKVSDVIIKSSANTTSEEYTTVRLVALDTPSEVGTAS
jgi:hypothetical protein